MKKLTLILLAVILTVNFAFADSFQDELQRLAKENAKGYLTPFATAFGTDMNSGLFYSAKPHKVLGFDFGIRMMFAFVPDEDMTYSFQMPTSVTFNFGGVDYEVATDDIYTAEDLARLDEAPTIFGDDAYESIMPDEQLLDNATGNVIDDDSLAAIAEKAAVPIPPGFDISGLPLAIPQISVGLPMKSEVMLRFFPKTKVSDDIGDFGFFGIGVKHSISQYIPLFPLHISAQFAYQSLKFGDIITSKHTAFNVHASKTFAMFTPYVGLGFESSSIEVDYTIEGTGNLLVDGTPVKFDLDGDNGFRARVGFTLKFLLLGINADYAIGKYSAATLGLFFTFR